MQRPTTIAPKIKEPTKKLFSEHFSEKSKQDYDSHVTGTSLIYADNEANSPRAESASQGLLPIIAFTERLRPRGVSFSGLRYMKGGRDFTR